MHNFTVQTKHEVNGKQLYFRQVETERAGGGAVVRYEIGETEDRNQATPFHTEENAIEAMYSFRLALKLFGHPDVELEIVEVAEIPRTWPKLLRKLTIEPA